MRGPEEWPSRNIFVADRIRLTGPAATKSQVLRSAQDFGSGLPLRSRPLERLNLQVRLPQTILGFFAACRESLADQLHTAIPSAAFDCVVRLHGA